MFEKYSKKRSDPDFCDGQRTEEEEQGIESTWSFGDTRTDKLILGLGCVVQQASWTVI